MANSKEGGADLGAASSKNVRSGTTPSSQKGIFSQKENEKEPNAFLIKKSRYLKKEKRDVRLFLSPHHDDFLFVRDEVDLKMKYAEYVFEELYDPLAEESPKIRELTTRKITYENEYRDKCQKLSSICLEVGRPLSEAQYATDQEVRNLYDRCKELPKEIQDMQEQIDHIKQNRAVTTPNPEVLPLQRAVNPQEPFPIDALGPIMGPAASRIIMVNKVSDAVCAGSFLATASLCTQGHRDIEIDGRRYPLSEFFLSIALSGDRKSSADRLAIRAVKNYEANVLTPTFEAERKIWENKRDANRARRQKLLRTCPDNLEAELENLIEPEYPLEPFLICAEPTVAGLEHLFFHGQPSIGLFSDEGGRFFGGYSMSKENLLNTIAFLSKCWDGDPITRIRKDERLRLFGRRLASSLLIQPVVFENILKSDALKEQGILARYLIACPLASGNTGAYDNTDLTQDEALVRYWTRCNEILDVEGGCPCKEGKIRELDPKPIYLSFEAKSRWRSFYESVERELSQMGKYRVIYPFAKKAGEHALRIGGILQAFDDLKALEITVSTMDRAIAIVQWYLNESIRIHGAAPIDRDLDLAQKTLEFLRKRSEKEFPLWVIYKDGPGAVRNKKMAEKMIAVLEDHGYVAPISCKKGWWALL